MQQSHEFGTEVFACDPIRARTVKVRANGPQKRYQASVTLFGQPRQQEVAENRDTL